MNARPASSLDRAWTRLRAVVLCGLVCAAVLVWLSERGALTQEASLALPPVLQVAPDRDEAAPAGVAPEHKAPPPAPAQPDPIVRLYLPAVDAGPPLRVPVAPPPAPDRAAPSPAQESVGQSQALPLPDPWRDVPLSAARRFALAAHQAAQTEGGRALADGLSEPAAVAGSGEATSAPATALSVGGGTAAVLPDDPSVRWIWPVEGRISQNYSSSHRAIDVVAPHGTLVAAADAGEVVYAEWEVSGYGYLVIVDHGDGYRTYYGHLYGFYVDVGQWVERGDLLGQLGNTGNSTGPHLHFAIRHQGVSQDPMELLPADRR